MLRLENLTKEYGSFRALKGLTLGVKTGEVFGLLGPNGAGKSTLIKILTCFHKPTSGDAFVDDISVTDASRLRMTIGWAPQDDAFYPKLTVFENLKYFGALYGLTLEEIFLRSHHLLKLMQIENKRDAFAGSLSGGMKRRLNMAIAMIHKPKVLFLDEPTAGVDPLSRMTLWDVIDAVRKEKMTVLLCTHYLDEADKLCDRVAILRAGALVTVDTPAHIKSRYGSSLEEAFKHLLTQEVKQGEKN
jgi:ABC-2 type transport system ATP-binding protein